MACGCTPTVIVDTSKKKCENCLKVVSLRYACADGPNPCGGAGGTLIEDLTAFNDVTACACGSVKYSITYFDPVGFSSVTITEAGVLTAITTDEFDGKKEYKITYKVDCPCSLLSGTGNIYVCKKNLCSGVNCSETQYCDQCDGLCKNKESDLDVTGGKVSTSGTGGTGFA